MSTIQKMTLIGLYNYEQTFARDLFRSLSLPEGYDKTTFVNSLLLEHGEKCVLYTNPDFFVQAIGIWGSKYELELERIYEALTAEYNPIYNYDRYEEFSDHEGIKNTVTTNAGHKATDSPKYDDDVTNDYDIVTEQNTNGTVEHQVSADNSGEYQPEAKDISNNGKTTVANDGTIKRHIEGKTQDLTESSNAKTQDDTARNFDHEAHLYGNIGVTTSSSMVSEIVRQRFSMSLYGIACKMFANELLIGLY